MTDIVIGGPIANRGWIIERWYQYVEIACDNAGVKPVYLHVVPAGDPTMPMLAPDAIVWTTDEPVRPDKRIWNHDRYRHMVDLRNQGLAIVRELEPRWFLSLDSDILLHPDSLRLLIDALENPALPRSRFDAVGGRCYMTGTAQFPSYGMLVSRTGGIRRKDVPDGLFPVDVIMAIKLMSPKAYAVDYQFHPHGEDIGWSNAARAVGCRLGWDGRTLSTHIPKDDT